MEIQEILEKSGLKEKETDIYLALLELGTATGYAVARKAEQKRPTTYVILDNLKRQGLVTSISANSKELFTAESPERLLSHLTKKSEMLKRGLPQLLALYNSRKDKPQVQLFEGKEAVREVYEKIFQYPEVQFIGTTRETIKLYPEILDMYAAKLKQGQIKARELLARTDVDQKYLATVRKHSNYPIRLIPQGMELLTDSAIYENNVAFFSFHPQVLAVVITSKEISHLMKTLFEIAWLSAEPV